MARLASSALFLFQSAAALNIVHDAAHPPHLRSDNDATDIKVGHGLKDIVGHGPKEIVDQSGSQTESIVDRVDRQVDIIVDHVTDMNGLDGLWDGIRTEESGPPDLMKVAIVAILALVVVLILDIVGHIIDSFIEDDADRLRIDSMIDGAAAFCALVISNTWYSVISEYIMTQRYETGFFPSTLFLILSCRIIIVGIALIIMFVMKERIEPTAIRSAVLPGIFGSMCSFCGETSLLYLTYPVVALFKSSSIVPTMAINTLVNGEYQTAQMYLIAMFISVCVAGFTLESAKDDSPPRAGKDFGMMLIITSVLAGSLAASTQKSVFSKYPDITATQMMLVCGVFTCMGSFAGVAGTTGFQPLFLFLEQNPDCIKHIAALGLSGAMGYFFIFYIVSSHGPVCLAIMMVVKQVVSIVLSAALYNHPLTGISKMCAMGTFAGVLASTYLSTWSAKEDPAMVALQKKKSKSNFRSMMRISSHANFSSFRDLGEWSEQAFAKEGVLSSRSASKGSPRTGSEIANP